MSRNSLSLRTGIKVIPVKTMDERAQSLEVLKTTYQNEKHWVDDVEGQMPVEDLTNSDISWFLALRGGKPVGVLRVHYAPPLGQYVQYGVEFFDKSIDVEAFLAKNRIAEIGRFAVVPSKRNQMLVAAALIRASTIDTVRRKFTHYVTDVFEDDPNSPYGFHTRVMGFTPVGSHMTGELYSQSRRITLVLDLASAYKRLQSRGNWIFRYLTEGWDEGLHKTLA